jgi:thiol-disulfide isomerase/thioredoxin
MRYFFIFLSILFSVNVIAQSSGSFTIKGNVANEKSWLYIYNYEIPDTIKPDKSGYFEYNKDISSPQYLSFFSRTIKVPITIFAVPGDVINISYDAKDFYSTINITSGKNPQYPEYFLNQDIKISFDSLADEYSESSTNSGSTFKSVDEFYKKSIKKFDEFFDKDIPLSSEFIETEPVRLKLNYAYLFTLTLQKINEKYNYYENPGSVLDSFLYANKLDEYLNYEKMLQLESFHKLLSVLLNFNTFDIKTTEYSDNEELYSLYEKNGYNYIKTNFSNPRISSFLIYTHLKMWFSYLPVDSLANRINDFLNSSANESYKNNIRQKYNNTVNFKEGFAAPDFTLPDINGNLVSLSDFKGKVVFIDFWAYWCGPCKYETPFLKELEKHYEYNPDIAIISLSVDPDETEWRKYIKENDLSGILLIDDEDTEAANTYQIKFIPKFVIIDKQGKLNNLEAPRPSQKSELTSILDKLISE